MRHSPYAESIFTFRTFPKIGILSTSFISEEANVQSVAVSVAPLGADLYEFHLPFGDAHIASSLGHQKDF